jgi:hypothetical protein
MHGADEAIRLWLAALLPYQATDGASAVRDGGALMHALHLLVLARARTRTRSPTRLHAHLMLVSGSAIVCPRRPTTTVVCTVHARTHAWSRRKRNPEKTVTSPPGALALLAMAAARAGGQYIID